MNGRAVAIQMRTPSSVKQITVLEVRSLRGSGDGGDVIREVTQYWDVDGNLLAERDPMRERPGERS